MGKLGHSSINLWIPVLPCFNYTTITVLDQNYPEFNNHDSRIIHHVEPQHRTTIGPTTKDRNFKSNHHIRSCQIQDLHCCIWTAQTTSTIGHVNPSAARTENKDNHVESQRANGVSAFLNSTYPWPSNHPPAPNFCNLPYPWTTDRPTTSTTCISWTKHNSTCTARFFDFRSSRPSTSCSSW